MHDRSAGFRDSDAFSLVQMDRVAIQCAFPEQPVHLVGFEIVPGFRVQAERPRDFVGLFREMGLHQAIRVLGPEGAKGFKLFRR